MATKATKKFILLIAAVVVLCCMVNAHAYTWSGSCEDGLTWTLNDDGVLTIEGQGKMRTRVVEQPWYSLRSSIRSVVISDGVLSIGEYAFDKCTNLTSVKIGRGVASIENCAFYNCYNLTNISIPGNVRDIKSNAFWKCDSLTSVTLEAGTRSIGYSAFDGCDSLTDIYYGGTKAQWDAMDISVLGNKMLLNATIHYSIPTPTVKSSYISASGKPYISWNKIAEATKYEVYRATSKTGTYTRIGTTTKRNYTDSTAKAGTTYFYKVRAVNADGSMISSYSTPVTITCRCSKPVAKPSYVGASGKPYVYWSAVEGAKSYSVYRAATENGTYSYIGNTTKRNYTDATAVVGTTYYYKVKAISADKTAANSAYSAVVTITCRCARPVVKIATNTSGKPRLTWSAVAGASKYDVYRSTSENGTYTKVFTTTGTSYTNTSAQVGITYYYKVRAVSSVKSKGNSAFSTIEGITCRCAKPVVQITTSGGKPMLTWNAVTGAAKYEVYRATSKDGIYTKLYTTTGTRLKNTSAVAGTTYYYKVKAISGVKSAGNSVFSTVVSIRAN